MTLYDSIFGLISVVTSLALAQLITGAVNIARTAEAKTVSLIHVAWIWLAFVLVIGNWASLIAAQANPHWSPTRILLWLVAMISLYTFTAFVLPGESAGEAIDLRRFERTQRRSYVVAHNAFACSALVLIFGVRGITLDTVKLALAPLIALGLGTAALWAERTWVRATIAALLVVNGSVMTWGLLASLSN